MKLLAFTKAELLLSNTEKGHPFRYFYLSTFGEFPETRTVVNRGVSDELEITFFTDSRTPKVEQMKQNNKVSALFYHPDKQLQLRLYGEATILTRRDERAYAPYLKQVLSNADWTKDYGSVHIPGTPKKDEGTIIYGNTINLNVIKIKPVHLDIVLLGVEKHHRSKCKLVENMWTEKEVVP
ncbi:MAG: pyridoxamine 5'-phosphate oxidase family protein [Bacteroidota bacterium]